MMQECWVDSDGREIEAWKMAMIGGMPEMLRRTIRKVGIVPPQEWPSDEEIWEAAFQAIMPAIWGQKGVPTAIMNALFEDPFNKKYKIMPLQRRCVQ